MTDSQAATPVAPGPAAVRTWPEDAVFAMLADPAAAAYCKRSRRDSPWQLQD